MNFEMLDERKASGVVILQQALKINGQAYISVYFYSKTNHMHNISNLFYFGTTIYMYRTVSSSIIRSLRLFIQHQVRIIQVLWLLASGNEMELLAC
jgi:hypothetical protein